jgi:hypothetical protein
MPKQEEKQTSTQAFIPIKEIKDGIVVLKTGYLRTVILARGGNFELKSENEQNAIIYSYQQFLNGLEFPLQIIVKSRKKDLKPYVASLKQYQTKQKNESLRRQTVEYINFIEQLMEVSNIMTKEFYIIIPFNPYGEEKKGASGFFNFLSKTGVSDIGFEKNKVAILERTDNIISALSNIGLQAVQLNTRELIEFFYTTYNPEVARSEKLTDFSQMTSPVISGKPGAKPE